MKEEKEMEEELEKLYALQPTQETVGGYVNKNTGITTITSTLNKQYDFPVGDLNFDTDAMFFQIKIHEPGAGASIIYARIKDETVGKYSNIAYIDYYSGEGKVFTGLCSCPWNMNGHNVDLYLGTNAVNIDVSAVKVNFWGHSPHKHQ